MYRQTCDCACAPLCEGASFRGCFCSCSAAELCRHAPTEEGQRRRADGNGNDTAASSTPRGHAVRWCVRLDTETAGQREARLETNAAEWCKATGLCDGRAAAVQRSFGSNKQGPWLLRQLQSVTSHYTCLLGSYYSCCEAILKHLAYALYRNRKREDRVHIYNQLHE